MTKPHAEIKESILPEQMMIKVRDHRGPETDMISMSDTFWAKMKAKYDERKWVIVH